MLILLIKGKIIEKIDSNNTLNKAKKNWESMLEIPMDKKIS